MRFRSSVLNPMDHQDHVRLLRDGIPAPGGVWADMGSGNGAFTLALAECIGGEGEIYSVDKNGNKLKQQQRLVRSRYPEVKIQYLSADFTRLLQLPPLDGIVMANTLHFLRSKDATLSLIKGYLKPSGHLIVIEYNTDRGNQWVPYPFSYKTWQVMARQNGFDHTKLLHIRPSSFLGEIYSAVSWTAQYENKAG